MIGTDKLLHFIACETICLAGSAVGLIVGLAEYAFPVAFILSLAAGVVKEILDRKTTGFDFGDLAADALGAFAGVVFASLIYALC